MSDVALRPLNTSLVRASIEVDGRTLSFESVDIDVIASQVFAAIDAMETDLKPAIAAKLVDALAAWTGQPGTPEQFEEAKRELTASLSRSLASAYERETPRRAHPFPTSLTVEAASAPLASRATIDDARKWILMWEASPIEPSDHVVTWLSTDGAATDGVIDASAFERALLAFHVAPGEETLRAIAATPIEVPAPSRLIPTGPATGYATFDNTQRMGVRAVTIRNAGFPDGFVYTAELQSEIFAPAIERAERITIDSLDEVAALAPARVEVWYEYGNPLSLRLPVVLVLEQFDSAMVEAAIAAWHAQTDVPPDGQFCLDVTAERLRLRNVALNPSATTPPPGSADRA